MATHARVVLIMECEMARVLPAEFVILLSIRGCSG